MPGHEERGVEKPATWQIGILARKAAELSGWSVPEGCIFHQAADQNVVIKLGSGSPIRARLKGQFPGHGFIKLPRFRGVCLRQHHLEVQQQITRWIRGDALAAHA
ncbi:hypothetical protein CF70_030280 [Cupriavidus sp. SK-3]|nr:hypothetical protein CF70_030280 [Cupriavidus sp. SK-3]